MPLVQRIIGSRNPRPRNGICPVTGDTCGHRVTPSRCRAAVLQGDHYYQPTGLLRLLPSRPAVRPVPRVLVPLREDEWDG